MTRPAKPAIVRFYFDADVLGLAKVIVQLRPDCTYPGDHGGVVHKRLRPPCPITSASILDRDWIPEVAQQGWLIITRDRHIRDHRAEISAVRKHGAKMITLAGEEARGTWDQLEVLMCQWRAIERFIDESGPFIYRATRPLSSPSRSHEVLVKRSRGRLGVSGSQYRMPGSAVVCGPEAMPRMSRTAWNFGGGTSERSKRATTGRADFGRQRAQGSLHPGAAGRLAVGWPGPRPGRHKTECGFSSRTSFGPHASR